MGQAYGHGAEDGLAHCRVFVLAQLDDAGQQQGATIRGIAKEILFFEFFEKWPTSMIGPTQRVSGQLMFGRRHLGPGTAFEHRGTTPFGR